MSLSYELSKIENYESVCFEETPEGRRKRPVTEALIFHTIGTGIGEITEETLAEVYARINAREKLHGAMVTNPVINHDNEVVGWEPYFITEEDVRQHIGLTTNVFPYEPRETWARRMFEQAYDLRDEPYVRAEEADADQF